MALEPLGRGLRAPLGRLDGGVAEAAAGRIAAAAGGLTICARFGGFSGVSFMCLYSRKRCIATIYAPLSDSALTHGKNANTTSASGSRARMAAKDKG